MKGIFKGKVKNGMVYGQLKAIRQGRVVVLKIKHEIKQRPKSTKPAKRSGTKKSGLFAGEAITSLANIIPAAQESIRLW